jgi:hypothetical protein
VHYCSVCETRLNKDAQSKIPAIPAADSPASGTPHAPRSSESRSTGVCGLPDWITLAGDRAAPGTQAKRQLRALRGHCLLRAFGTL